MLLPVAPPLSLRRYSKLLSRDSRYKRAIPKYSGQAANKAEFKFVAGHKNFLIIVKNNLLHFLLKSGR